MTDNEKQIVEQVVGASLASVEATVRLVLMLVRTKTLTPDQAALTFSDITGHIRDLAERNRHIEGQSHVLSMVADRYDALLKAFQRETGATVDLSSLQ